MRQCISVIITIYNVSLNLEFLYVMIHIQIQSLDAYHEGTYVNCLTSSPIAAFRLHLPISIHPNPL